MKRELGACARESSTGPVSVWDNLIVFCTRTCMSLNPRNLTVIPDVVMSDFADKSLRMEMKHIFLHLQ